MKSRIVYMPSGRPRNRLVMRKMIISMAFGAAVLLICGGAVFALRASRLQIRDIAVSGMKTLDEQAVRERIGAALAGTRAWVLPRSSFFLADTGAIAADLKQDFPRIRDATFTKRFPDKLEGVITEREFWGIFCNGSAGSSTPACPHTQCASMSVGACAYIDPGGIAYEHAPKPQGKLIISVRSDGAGDIALGASAVDLAVMAEIRNLAEKIPPAAGIAIADFELRTRVPSEIRAIAADGFTMIFKREDDYAPTLHVLKRVMDEEIRDKQSRLDYIDLRFGNKVFYKLK